MNEIMQTMQGRKMQEAQEIELKPCPFCGEKAKILSQHGVRKLVRYYALVCSDACQIYSIHLDKSIEAWNKRVNE